MSSAAPILFRGISDVNDIEQLTNKRRYIAMACDFWSENGYWKKIINLMKNLHPFNFPYFQKL